jgi:DNA repair exonuclease SbcCD ATPase subunit
MVELIGEKLDQQLQTLIELEDELEMEISRVISLKNSIDPELIEDIEKIEEGLYVEVKMIHETKKGIEKIIKNLKDDDGTEKNLVLIETNEVDNLKADVEKYKKRSEKIAKLTNNMDKELKKRESKLKNELITKLKDKDTSLNEKLMKAKYREEELLNELEGLKAHESKGSDDIGRMKAFFDKKIQNVKKTMTDEHKQKEKEIAEKVIIVYNKKKEKIYNSAIQEALKMSNRTEEVELILKSLRDALDLADDVYVPENFFLCEKCGEAIHISQNKCPACNTKYKIE